MSAAGSGGVLVLGAGGHGKSVLSVLLASGREVVGILDDDPRTWGTEVLGRPVLGPLADLATHPEHCAVLGLGDNPARRAAAERFPSARWTEVVYPGAYVNPSARIGRGSVVFPGAVIGADVVLGEHVIVSAHTTIGHDTIIGDFVQIAPGVQVAGAVAVGAGAMLAIGSIVGPGVRIGDGTVLAAGAVAVYDLPPGCTAFGIPARPREASRA